MKDLKIVSCSPAHTEILCMLGREELIVGKTAYCDFPKDLLKEKTIVGSWTKLNFDIIEELKPDLIITSSIVQEKIALKLKEFGFNVYHFDPLMLNEIYEDIMNLGDLTESTSKAEEIINNMKADFLNLQLRIGPEKVKPKVYVEEWHDPPTISGNWVSELVNIAGGNYSLIKAGKRSVPISIDKLFEYNPDKIIISWCGFGEKVDIIQVLNRSGWDLLSAIKNKEVFIINDSLLNRPGPRLVEGAKKLQEILYSKKSLTV